MRESLGEIQRPRRAPDPAEEAQPAAEGWLQAERQLLAATLVDSGISARLEAIYPAERFQDPVLREIAHAIRNLHEHGESTDYESLRAHLADRDDAVHALGKMIELSEEHSGEEVVARAKSHLDQLERSSRLHSALESQSLEAVLKARKGTT